METLTLLKNICFSVHFCSIHIRKNEIRDKQCVKKYEDDLEIQTTELNAHQPLCIFLKSTQLKKFIQKSIANSYLISIRLNNNKKKQKNKDKR